MLKSKSHKKFSERIIEGILLLAGSVSSIAVLLIVFFLFSEGFTIFSDSPVEENYVLAVHPSNNVSELEAAEVKDIFDEKIIKWSELGGSTDSILKFRLDDIADYYTEEEIGKDFENLPLIINKFIAAHPDIIAFVPKKFLPQDFQGKVIEIENIDPGEFLLGVQWYPTAEPAALMGVLPLILGTLWVTFGAIVFALPFGIACAIYMAEIASERVRKFLKPVIELLAGIPSVVYGFFGLVIVVPAIQEFFGLPVGETALAGSIILGIMALPTIITISEDALRNTPRAMKEASLALGATHWQTIARVVLPYASSGLTTAAILGIGRAVGETMAVLMVTGNAAKIPSTFLEPVRTIPATIAAELGEAPSGGLHYKSLFALGCILFLMTLVINLSVSFVARNKRRA